MPMRFWNTTFFDVLGVHLNSLTKLNHVHYTIPSVASSISLKLLYFSRLNLLLYLMLGIYLYFHIYTVHGGILYR